MKALPRLNANRFFIVIVLYQSTPGDAPAFFLLKKAMKKLSPADLAEIAVLLFDNTPGGCDPGNLPVGVKYESAGRNAGLAAAYNRALEIAESIEASWLLLLDQDTSLPCTFLETLRAQIELYESNSDVVALAPTVRSGGTVVSPKRVGVFSLKTLHKSVNGIQDEEVTCVNSGTAVRCDFLRSIGGFNRAYWLDYLDHWLFRQVYRSGKKVAVWDCFLEHNLSVLDYRNNVSLARYHSILTGESAFITSHKPKVQIPFYLFRLLWRSGRLLVQRQPQMALLTLSTVARIVAHPKRSLEVTPE